MKKKIISLLLALTLSLCLALTVSAEETYYYVYDEAYLLTADEEAGCLWLAENMGTEELFATNRMHTGQALEGLSNVYSGLSGRQAYCESIKYALSNMGDQTGDIVERYNLMEELFREDTTPERVREICTQCGITYLLYHPASPGTDTHLQGFEAVYASPELTIYRVN